MVAQGGGPIDGGPECRSAHSVCDAWNLCECTIGGVWLGIEHRRCTHQSFATCEAHLGPSIVVRTRCQRDNTLVHEKDVHDRAVRFMEDLARYHRDAMEVHA